MYTRFKIQTLYFCGCNHAALQTYECKTKDRVQRTINQQTFSKDKTKFQQKYMIQICPKILLYNILHVMTKGEGGGWVFELSCGNIVRYENISRK